MKNILVIPVLCFFLATAHAQSKTGKGGYYFYPQVALLNGDHSASAQVQLVGGIQKKAWLFGLGTAIDYYKVRTVPVFADLRYFFGKSNHLFSYANIGANIAWALESQYESHFVSGTFVNNSFSNGLYTDVGVGYAFQGNRVGSCVISIGYSSKTISSSYQEAVYTQFPPYTVSYYDRKMDYTFNRLVLRLGVRL